IVAHSGIAIHVDTQELSEKVGERLRVRGMGILTNPDIELPVAAEMDAAAIVVGSRAQVVKVQNRGFAAKGWMLWIAIVDREATELIVFARSRASGVGIRVVKVDKVVRGVIGVEGDS